MKRDLSAEEKAEREEFEKIIAYLAARHKAQTAALIDTLTPFLSPEQRASAIERWELIAEQKGWASSLSGETGPTGHE